MKKEAFMKHFKSIYNVIGIGIVCALAGYTLWSQKAKPTHFNPNEAISVQVLPDGRYVALLPVPGGAAWFVVEAPVAQNQGTHFYR